MEKRKSFPVWLGIASTWFGMHCGSGFATGSQYVIYYNIYGWLAMIMPLITWTILGFAYYFIFEYGRRTNVLSYKEYGETVFIKKFGIIFVILLDLWCLFAQVLGEAGILAGAGALFESNGLNYWIGVLVAGAIVLVSVIYGATFIMKISTVLTVGLVICITILGIIGVAANWENFVAVLSQRQMTEGTTFWQALGGAFTCSGVQIGAMFALLGLSSGLASRKESKKAAIGGAALNCIMLIILGLVMIANFPAINSETLPVLTALSALNIPVLTNLYSIMLLLALVTTGAGCAFAIVSRYKGYVMKLGLSERLASALIAVVLMAIGVFGSRFGLTAIFSTGYGYLSKLAWPLGLLPALIILPIRLHMMNKEKKDKEIKEVM